MSQITKITEKEAKMLVGKMVRSLYTDSAVKKGNRYMVMGYHQEESKTWLKISFPVIQILYTDEDKTWEFYKLSSFDVSDILITEKRDNKLKELLGGNGN